MIKLNNTIYNKMQLQSEEAKEQGLLKLAESVKNAIGDSYNMDHKLEYSSEDLDKQIHRYLWKIATTLTAFHNLESIDIEKVDKTLISWADKIVNDLEKTLQIPNTIKGPLEPKLPGEE